MQMYKYFDDIFYAYLLKENYEANKLWPEGGKDVDEEIFTEFSGLPPDGKIRGTDNEGSPAWIDKPEPTHAELIAFADAEKQSRIVQANVYINSKQWPGKAAIGRLKGDELAQYNLWLDYLDALEAADTSTAPVITWPTPPVV
ncbi:tail fiber assembly protein [Enterobacter sp. FUJ80071]|uniref:tail fiber assembly protein n=1 Tax=Enterobacter sp. FUJ80071 TaxID=3024862 RepID=UPI003169FFF6